MKSRLRWSGPVILVVWAGAWFYIGAQNLATRQFGFSWTRSSEHIDARPDTHPYIFWGCTAIAFTLGIAGICAAIFALRRAQKEH